jgi:hypothetical protein
METEEENPWFGNLTVWIVMRICRKSIGKVICHIKNIYAKKVANVCRQKGVCGTPLEHLEKE